MNKTINILGILLISATAARAAGWATRAAARAAWAARATGWAADAAAENAACMARDAVEGVEDATLEEARGREAQWQVDALIKRLE